MFMDTEIIKEMSRKEKRLDNREANEYRNVKIEKGVVSSAAGSARVTLGDTKVVAGIKIETGTPFEDSFDEGVLMVAVEFIPFAYSEFESGPPSEESIEFSRVVDRAIRESKCIDFKKLCITEGEKVWMINIDIDVLDNGGNLIDACGLAAAAALADAKIPDMDEKGKPIYDKRGKESLPMNSIPVSTTFVKIGGSIFSDPTIYEEDAMDARLTVGTVEKEGKIFASSMQKGGIKGLTQDEIDKIIGMAEEKGKELRKLVQE